MTIMPAKLNWWYESVADWMLSNPDKTLKDCAAVFDVTPTWIYTLTKSKPFIEALGERRDMQNTLLSVGIVEKYTAVAEIAIDHLAERLSDTGPSLSAKTLSQIADTTMARLGYGGNRGGTVNPVNAPQQVTNIFIDQDLLGAARSQLRARQASMGAPPPPLNLDHVADNVPVIDGMLTDDTLTS